jgi:hypothetical protein
MIDMSRYKGLLVVCVGLYCAAAVCNAALYFGFGKDPAMFDNPDRQLAWSQLERSGAQVAGVELQMRRAGTDSQPDFGVIVGQSTTMRGIDPLLLQEHVQPQMPWLLVNGFGSSFVKLNYYSQTLLASKLRPSVVVLGLHETMLAGQDRANRPRPENGDQVESAQPEQRQGLRRRVKHLVALHWVRKQRKNISHFTNMSLFEMRLSLQKTLGSGAVGLFQPDRKPWRTPGRKQNVGKRKEQHKGWNNFGWFEAETYDTNNQHADAFRELIAGCDDLGVQQIVIVLLPITSDLRGWLPPQAGEQMMSLIDEVSVGRPVRVIDLRDVMPDDVFADYAHLKPAGREVFSRLLAEHLNDTNRAD